MLKHLPLWVALAALWPAALLAQPDLSIAGAIDAGDPVYHRVYVDAGTCRLSSFGSAVGYDVHELLLDTVVTPLDLVAATCAGGAGFDSVLYLYQRADAGPRAFRPGLPCENLVAYDDDFCGPQSSVASALLVAGHLEVVITTFADGEGGPYTIAADSLAAPLADFVFYSGFEQADTRSWSRTVL